jgi:hypothetical protein
MVYKELPVTVAAFMKPSEYYTFVCLKTVSWPPFAGTKSHITASVS